jgi:hypothetical protein
MDHTTKKKVKSLQLQATSRQHFFFFWDRSCYVAKAGLELTTLLSHLLSSGISSMCHHTLQTSRQFLKTMQYAFGPRKKSWEHYQLTGKSGHTSGKVLASNLGMFRKVRPSRRRSSVNLLSVFTGCFTERNCKFVTYADLGSLPRRYGLKPLISQLKAECSVYI